MKAGLDAIALLRPVLKFIAETCARFLQGGSFLFARRGILTALRVYDLSENWAEHTLDVTSHYKGSFHGRNESQNWMKHTKNIS